eukprot:scaffold170_cov281-Pinguiococcus_pyrenoidosus.AAC.14
MPAPNPRPLALGRFWESEAQTGKLPAAIHPPEAEDRLSPSRRLCRRILRHLELVRRSVCHDVSAASVLAQQRHSGDRAGCAGAPDPPQRPADGRRTSDPARGDAVGVDPGQLEGLRGQAAAEVSRPGECPGDKARGSHSCTAWDLDPGKRGSP